MMKRLTAMIGLMVLAACNNAAEEGSTPEIDTIPSDEEAPGFQVTPGLYATGDGTTIYAQTRLSDDGTYVDLAEGEVVGSGTWAADGATMCLDPEGDGEDQQERCWTNGPVKEDGSFTSTLEDGSQSYVVTPISE